MARFFKTSEGNLQDDFVFQPNWELAQLALQKKDNEIANQIETMNLWRDLPIEFWKEADEDNVNEIRNEYNNRVDDLAMKLQKDLLNTSGNRMLLNNLQRDIEKDYESGRINQIQENALAYKQFMEKLNALANPADRETQKRMVDDYLNSFADSDTKGAFNSIFSPGELYNHRNLINEYFASGYFDRLTPKEKSEQIMKVGNKLMVKTSEGSKELSETRIGQSFLDFIQAEGLEGYGRNRQEYRGEQWLDEEGNIRTDEGSYVYDLMQGLAKNLAYKNTSFAEDKSYNPVYLQRSYNRNSVTDMPIGPVRDASFFLNWTPEGRAITEDYKNRRTNLILGHMTENDRKEYNRLATVLNNPQFADTAAGEASRKEMDGLIKKVERVMMQNTEWAEVLTKMDKEYESMGYAGFAKFTTPDANGVAVIQTQQDIDKVIAAYDSQRFISGMENTPGYIDLGNNTRMIDGKSKNAQHSFFVTDDKGDRVARNLTMDEMKGRKIGVGPYKGKKILYVEAVEKTGTPMDLTRTSRGLVSEASVVDVKIYVEGEERNPMRGTFYAPNFVFDIN